MNVIVLGAGKMVEAILVGLKDKSDLSLWNIFTPSGKSAERLAQIVGARAVSSLDQVSKPDLVIIGCKPQQLESLKETLNGKFQDSLYVSLLAAIDEAEQRRILGVKKLIRVMPNLPVRYREGVSLISSDSATKEMNSVTSLFSHLGVTVVLKENELEELTLLTGSGPAFFYEFTSSLSQGFESLDISSRESLARQVLRGAAFTSMNEESSLQKMIGDVSSKGGVTIAVIEEWRKKDFMHLLKQGIKAGKKRTLELKELLRQK